jgi:glycosyltransferase involved in cell wall biosynthesis
MKYRLVRMTAGSMALKVSTRGQPKYMSEHGFEVTMISSAGWELPGVIALEGCPHIEVNLTRKLSPLSDIRSIYKLYRIFKKLKPHIIHTENLKANLAGPIAGYFAGVPVRIQTMAGLVSPVKKGFKGWLIRQAEILSFKFATDVWPNSHKSMEYMIRTKMVTASKTKVIGRGSTNGIDLERFNPDVIDKNRLEEIKKTVDYSDNDQILLFAGRMVKDKGVEELVAAFVRLQHEFPQVKLVLLGPQEADLDPLNEGTINTIRDHKRIVHIDWTDEVEYYLSIATLFVFPSYREGFPNVIMQAGAMKCPVVCSDIVGNNEIVTHRVNGILHASQDEGSLYEAVCFALQNKEFMNQLALKLQHDMVTYYDRYNIYELYIKEYKELVAKRSKGAIT